MTTELQPNRRWRRMSIAARELEVSTTTLWRWTKLDGFPPIHHFSGNTLIDMDQLDAWIASHDSKGRKAA